MALVSTHCCLALVTAIKTTWLSISQKPSTFLKAQGAHRLVTCVEVTSEGKITPFVASAYTVPWEICLLSLYNPRDMQDWRSHHSHLEQTLLTFFLQMEISQGLDFNHLFIQLINTNWDIFIYHVLQSGVGSILNKNIQNHDCNGVYNLVGVTDN